MLIGIFLFLKQIVDVIYELKVLDVLMVVFALALIGVQSVRLYKDAGINRSEQSVFALIRKQILPIDYAVLVIACLYALSFLRDIHAVNSIVKIESAFLIYVLGRLYGSKISDSGRWLAISGYLIIYPNMIYTAAHVLYIKVTARFFPWEEFQLENGGALYYYKTDLAIGIIIATIFIYIYSKAKVFKWITIVGATTYTLYYAKARMGKVIFASILVLIISREIIRLWNCKKANRSKKHFSNEYEKLKERKIGILEIIFSICVIFVVILFIMIQVSPVKQYDYSHLNVSEEIDTKIENITHSRQVIWWDTFHSMANEKIINRLFGIDLHNFAEYNGKHMMSHCLYLNMFFAIGYIGIFAFIAFLYMAFKTIGKVIDKDIRFIVSVLLMVFLIFGISMDPIEYTQISWFPFMFVGVAVSMASVKKQG